jgi:hypothetical protein
MKSNTPDGEKKAFKKSKPQLKSLLPQMKSDSGLGCGADHTLWCFSVAVTLFVNRTSMRIASMIG